MARPIWQDFIVDLGAPVSTPGVPFYIYCSDTDETIFQGVSYPAPGKSKASVRVNDIIADYILSRDPSALDTGVLMNFDIYSTASGSPVHKSDGAFWNDWSYEPGYEPWDSGMNFPITNTFVPGQYIMLSDPPGSVSVYDCDVYAADGTHTTPSMEYPDAAGMYSDLNTEFLNETQFFASTRFLVAPAGSVKVNVNTGLGTTEYLLSKSCTRYVLYYRNAYGGWDALPVEGKADQADNLTRFTTEKDYDNNRTSSRGKRNYVNEIRRSYEFWTGWLTEAQSLLMHHLLNSTAVYLHDIEEGTVRSLVLTGSKTEYKHGRTGLFAYRIEADLAQGRMRR